MASFSSAVSALGAVTPALGTAFQIINAGTNLASSISNKSNSDLTRQQQHDLTQLEQQQKINMEITQQNAALEQQKIAQVAADTESRRRAALKRAVARQRAQYGASGIGSSPGGSGEAVLLGLFDQSEEEKNAADALDTLRKKALDQGLSNQQTLNLLQTQQLKANQALERALL